MNRNEKNVNKLTMLGMMTALVFVSNYLRITMPIAIGGRTSFTLANIMCAACPACCWGLWAVLPPAWVPPSMT